MNYYINLGHGTTQSVLVADITNEITYLRINLLGKLLSHFKLLQFIPRKYHQSGNLGVIVQNRLYKFFPERTGSPRYQYRLFFQHG